MNIKEYIKSSSFKGILIGLCIAIVALTIFQVGISIGERRAKFAGRFGDSFERNFMKPGNDGFMQRRFPGGSDMPGGHGAVGQIVSIELPQIVVSGPDNLEKTVLVNDSTKIREFRDTVQADKLKVGDFIIVLGSPNDNGQVEAKLVRLMTPPPGTKSKSKLVQ